MRIDLLLAMVAIIPLMLFNIMVNCILSPNMTSLSIVTTEHA